MQRRIFYLSSGSLCVALAAALFAVPALAWAAPPQGWLTQPLPSLGIVVHYPPNLTVTQYNENYFVFETADSLGGFVINAVDTLSDAQTVVEWADNEAVWPFPDNWRNHFNLSEAFGFPALRTPPNGSPTYSVILKVGRKIIYVDNGVGREDRLLLPEQVFNTIIAANPTPTVPAPIISKGGYGVVLAILITVAIFGIRRIRREGYGHAANN